MGRPGVGVCLDYVGAACNVTLDPQAGKRGSLGRLLAYVEFAGQDFNATLVELGFARVYTEGAASRESDYLRLESAARSQGKGFGGSARAACCAGACHPSNPT